MAAALIDEGSRVSRSTGVGTGIGASRRAQNETRLERKPGVLSARDQYKSAAPPQNGIQLTGLYFCTTADNQPPAHSTNSTRSAPPPKSSRVLPCAAVPKAPPRSEPPLRRAAPPPANCPPQRATERVTPHILQAATRRPPKRKRPKKAFAGCPFGAYRIWQKIKQKV